MSFYDTIAEIQKNLGGGGAKPAGPFNSDGKVNFGTAKDVAQSLPAQPGAFAHSFGNAVDVANNNKAVATQANDIVEKVRSGVLGHAQHVVGTGQGIAELAATGGALGVFGGPAGIAGGALAGAGLGTAMWGFGEANKLTGGNLSKAMMAGTKGVRSNYAFVRDVTKHNAGLGFLSALGILGGAALGAGAIIATGGAAAPAVFAAAIGAYGAGRTERYAASHGAFNWINPNIRDSAVLAQSAAGQKKYNFGTDVVKAAARAVGFKEIDTTRGVGAVLSGGINIMAEGAATPDIKGFQLGSNLARTAFVGGVQHGTEGVAAGLMSKFINEPARQAERAAKESEIVKKTVAGENTPYTPLFNFLSKNDAATISQHPLYKGSQTGQLVAALMAGKSIEEQGLIYRATSLGDASAFTELQAKFAQTHAHILRYEGVLNELEGAGNRRIAYGLTRENGTPIALASKLEDNINIVKNEMQDLWRKQTDLGLAITNFASLTERGVSKFDTLLNKMGYKGVEDFRADMAKQSVASKLGGESYNLAERETALGNTVQKLVSSNTKLGAIARVVERSLDDKAHQTVPYDNSLIANARVRTTLRDAVQQKMIVPNQAKQLFDEFTQSVTEAEKDAVMGKVEDAIFNGVATKHNIPVNAKDEVLDTYRKITQDNRRNAKNAKDENRAYMLDEDMNPILSPMLISQLSNGHYLPDVELLDKSFSRYAKKREDGLSIPEKTAMKTNIIHDEFNSLWRSITLARIGFPVNILRDTTIRAYGDGALFYMMKDLGETTIHSMLNAHNSIDNIKSFVGSHLNKEKNLREVSLEINSYNNAIETAEKTLKDTGYNPEKPETLSETAKTHLKYLEDNRRIRDGLQARKMELLNNIEKPVVGRDPVSIYGQEYAHASAGVAGKIAYDTIRGKDTMRNLMSSNSQLAMENLSRSKTGGDVIIPTEFNQNVHLKSWESTLNNLAKNDPIAEKIMKHQTKEDIIKWIKSGDSGSYLSRFGIDKDLKRPLRYSDAEVVYTRILNLVNQFAPDSKLWNPLLEGKLDVAELQRLYPNWQDRPTIIGDLVETETGQNGIYKKLSGVLKDGVTWMATKPPSVLAYNPYYNVKYNHKLQSMAALANEQGIIPDLAMRNNFESVAHKYAMDQLKSKMNAFGRDANYSSAFNNLLAFFPALVEQFRAYGKITAEHPEFPLRILSMSPTSVANAPGYFGEIQTDSNGNRYIELQAPTLGVKIRVSPEWFNPINPTGGHILSASPLSGAAINEMAKRGWVNDTLTNIILPFGASDNSYGYLFPTVARRFAQSYQAWITNNGAQFNKDVNMFLDMNIAEYQRKNGKEPSDLTALYNDATKRATQLSFVRFGGSIILPQQPQYVSPLQKYSDELNKMTQQYGLQGGEMFAQKYPEYFILADKLSSNTSGINQDATSVGLARKYGNEVVTQILAQNKNFNLKNLGAIFNDSDYKFSASARAWLSSNTIPTTRQKFLEQGDALDTATTSIVNNGWSKWRRLNTIVSDALANNNPPLSSGKGYGKAIADDWKNRFLEQMKTENPLWYKEKMAANQSSNEGNLVDAITIAVNNNNMWKDLSKQTRWHAIVDYMNFRYEIHDELKRMGTTIDSNKAALVREKVGVFVDNLKKTDIHFAEFYDRYFDNDQFKYVYETK